MQFKKDLLRVFSSNFINLLIGLITGFLVPAFLSLDDYAYLKTFTLYLSYVGILHFGFIDGIYIKYGGVYESEINKAKLKGEHKFLVLFQLAITLISAIIGLLINDVILIAFSIAILPINIQTLFQFLYQALGEFKIYSKIMILTPNILLVANLLIIFVFKISNYWPFIIANIVTYYIVFIGLEIYFLRKYKGIKPEIDYSEMWSHFKIGSFIMVGNLSSMLFYATDRWFVKFALTTKDFAFYSFAVSMLALINILINSITMTFYPYLARGQEKKTLINIKKYLLIIGTLATGGYFAFEFVVSVFLQKYIPSLDIILVLFAGYPAMIIINALYVNLYKANKQEKKYVLAVFKMFVVSLILNFVAILFFKTNFSIALATTISFYIWFFYSIRDFKYLTTSIKEITFLIIYLCVFYACGLYLNSIIGFIAYYLIMTLLSMVFYKEEVKMLINIILKKNAKISSN